MAEKKAEVPAVPPKTEVVDWQKQLQAMALATAEAERPSGNWISFQGGRLKIGGNLMKDDKVKGIVVYSIFENQLYARVDPNRPGEVFELKYDADNPTSPICYAFGEDDENLAPHPDSAHPQSPTCAECQHNAWRSDLGGGKGKACKNTRRLAMMHESDLDKIDKAEIALAKLPVTSVKNWSTYASQLANVLKLPPLAVITEMSVVPNAKTQFQVEFQLVDKINDGAKIQQLLNRRKDINPLIFAPYDKPVEVPASGPKKF
jgi:hypothetical protein